MKNEVYIIGEIGQNHNGSVDLAKLIVDAASRPIHEDLFGLELKPMNAVKLTKRDLNQELSQKQMDAAYNSPHSFGKTYGEHRAFLELNDEQHFEVYQYAKNPRARFCRNPLCNWLFVYIKIIYS
jgi:sialic acid synthase SpsE